MGEGEKRRESCEERKEMRSRRKMRREIKMRSKSKIAKCKSVTMVRLADILFFLN